MNDTNDAAETNMREREAYETAVAGLIHWAEHVIRSTRFAGCARSTREAAAAALAVPELAVLHPWAASVRESDKVAKDVEATRGAAALVLNPEVIPDDYPETA